MIDVINAIKAAKGSKAKIQILSANKDNELLKLVLQMAYDKASFAWGLTLKQVLKAPSKQLPDMGLVKAIAWMTNSLGRTVKGNAALEAMHSILDSVSAEEAEILRGIINRDLRIGLNVKSINKAIPGLIHEVQYMRCGVFKPKHKIKFPAYLQVKMDGTWRELCVKDGKVSMWTRQGHEYSNPVLEELFAGCPDGRYIGELTIPGLSRVQANGDINSDAPSYDRIHFTLWDYVTDRAEPYHNRLQALMKAIPQSPLVTIVKTERVYNNKEALSLTRQWMQEGEEGAVLKDVNLGFKNGTSDKQLKIKHVIELDVRCTGFTEGKLDTSREGKVGAITFATDDGLIEGQTSGFDSVTLEQLTANKDAYIGKVMTVQCNDLQKAEGSSVYKLMHPRFVEFRDDKEQTDTLERAQELAAASFLAYSD